MRILRWAAVAATVLMSLMNLPMAFHDGGADLPAAFAWSISVLGLLGLAAATGLALLTPWGRPAVLGVGAVNLAGAVYALTAGQEGAGIGLTVSLIIVVLAALSGRAVRGAAPSPA